MAQVLVPGVAQAVVKGTVGGNPFANVWHWRFGSTTANWTQPNIQTLADTLFNSLKTSMAAFFATNVEYTVCDTVDIGSSTPVVGSSTAAAWPGTASGLALTPAACILVNYNIAARYRGGHPRLYLAAPSEQVATDGENIATTIQNQISTAIAAVVNAVVAALPGSGGGAAQHCVPRYTYTYTDNPTKHKYTKTRGEPVTLYTIQSYTCHPKVATQRRRLQTQ